MDSDLSWAIDVRSALSALDDDQSRVIRMVYFERQTLQQVADRMAQPVAFVTRVLAAGLQAFARLMLAKPLLRLAE